MGRAKNKKSNASTTPTAVQPSQHQSANLIAVAEPPPTVSSVSPARRSNGSRSPSTVNDANEILSALRPYEQLLPALRGVGMAKQRLLHQSLYAAGCTAAQALETYLKDKTLTMSRNETVETTSISGGQSSESEELRLLLNYVSVEMAAENLRKVCSGPDGKILLRDAENKILNEVAAAALAAFAAAASRRPSTKQVEYMMNPTASVDMPEDTNSQSSQLTGVVAAMGEHERLEPKQFQNPNALNPADPTSGIIPPMNVPIPAEHDDRLPWPSPLTQSTGTNTMPGIPIGITGKSSRKRAAPNSISRRRDRSDGTGELTDDGHLDLLDNEELESEEDYSDAELDEESEPISGDQLDASRHSDSPLEDFDYTDALLRFACTVGHVDIVKSLVKIRGSADYQSSHTSTMLMEACCAGQEEVTRELIASGANVNAVSATMNTPLIYASTAGKLECVRLLLQHPEIHVDMRNQSGHTALMEASSAGNLEIVELLLSHGADIFAIVENVDFKESSLSLASYRGHVDVVRSLLGLMPECAERVEELHAGLLEAAMDGHVEVARVLLDNGAPVNLPTENFESPLTLAACGGHYDLVNLLVERGADLEEPNDEGYTPLMEAAREGHRDVVELLLDHGANVNSKIEEGIETPLTLAASGGYLNIVEMLVSHGGDLTIGERTPLFEATQEGHIEVVKFIVDYLLKNVQNAQFVRDDISCSLVSAAETNNMELVDYFLEKNADINFFSKEGRTPLMEAAKQGHLTVIEALVNRGADVNIISPTNDATALSLACLFGRADVTQYLLEHGANPEVSLKDSVSCIIEASRNGNTDCARIVLDYIGVKGKEAAAQAAGGKKKPTNGTINDVSTAKAAEISQRPKIKPVSKLHSQQREPITQTIGTISVQHVTPKAPGSQHQFVEAVGHHQQQLCSCTDAVHQLTQPQQTPDLSTFLTQKVSPEWAAAASGIKGPILPNGGASTNTFTKTGTSTVRTAEQQKRGPQQSATVTTTTKQRHPAGSSGTTTTTTTATITATPVDPQNAAEILQQFPTDLMSSMMAAAANASMANSNQSNAAAVDEQMLAHFIQRSLVEPKRRDAAWTDQELSVFKDLVRQKMRALNPATMNTANVATSVQQQQITDLIEEHQEFMVANMLSGANLVGLDAECPGCAHSHAANFASSVHSKLGNVPPPNILPAAGGTQVQPSANNTARSSARTGVEDEMDRLARAASETQAQPSMKRKGSAIKTRATLSMQAECVGYGSRQVSGMRRNSTSREQPTGRAVASVTVKVKQKLAETSELLRSKLDAISMDVTSKSTTTPGQSATSGGASLEDAMQKFRELSATTAAQQQQIQQQHAHLQPNPQQQIVPHQLPPSFPMVPNTTGTIQSPVYYNRTMTGTATSTALTAEQQQQIIFYQQQEFHNLQNLQTAAGHHHITSTTGAIQSATPCHPGSHHPTAAQMNNLSQQMHSTAKLARRTGQPIGKHAPNCSGHIRANMSSQTTITGSGTITTDVHQVPAEVSSYVDMQTDANNDTALTVACVGGHASLVSLLIQRGASVEHRDKKGFTPLILAATGGHVECCKLLIEANCQIDAQSERTKDTALSLACSGGRKEVVELLLRYGANKEHRNVSDYTPLSLAASGGYVDIIYLLLDAGAEINSRTGSKLGISPLMLAAMNGHDAATLVLLERGSDINAQIETNRNTALTLACFQGRTEVVRLLLSFGANVEHRAKTGLTPLMEAANGGYTDVGALLLKHGADPNAPPVPTSRDTALTIAADKGHATFVSMLLNQGAVIDVKNKKGCTPLFLACSNGHLETVKILVKRRADVDALDNRKTSPLVAAFRKGYVKVVEFMVAHVNQFPNDLECHRYYNNLTDQDLANKVNLCLNVIVDAKAKQAEQANRAAESLLEQLAEEEALAESKKQSKKRLKEKKKAKKLAKRAAEVEIDEDENVVVEEEEPEPIVPIEVVKKFKEPEKPLTIVQPEPVVEAQPVQLSKSQLKKMKQAAARAASQNVVSKENTPDEQPMVAVEVEDPRVPQTINDLPAETNGPTKISPTAASTNGKESRRQNRGRRNENGQPTTTASRISIQPNATVMTSPQHSPNVGVKTSFTGATSAGNNSAEESEWLSAGKRRASSRPGKESNASRESVTNLSASSATKDPLRDLVTLMEDNQNVSDAWSMTEPNSKRRAFAITVTSSTVARIIGRAGQNINAIREATNAHIEVEKIATRREQATRQITVKGAPDSIRNAVTMIDLLIRDNESHVSDIIRRVVRTDSLNSPATVAGAPVILPPIVALEKTTAITATTSTSTTSQTTTPKQPSTTPTPPSSQTSFSTSSVRPMSSNAQPTMSTQQPVNASGTNVWQQRAAIRKMQQTNETTTSATSGSTATTPANQPTQQHSLSASTSESGSPAPQNSYVPQNFNHQPHSASQVVGMPLPMAVEMGTVQTPDPTAISPQDFALQLEELKRKAPGFERPHQQTQSKSTAGGQSGTTESRVDEISAMLSASANENSLGYSFGNDGNKFMAGLLDMPPNSNATNSHVASMALSGEDRRSTQRPLSEIWATPSTTTNSGIGEDTNLSGFSSLFGSDLKSAASLWLPPSELSGGTKSVKDDTWLDSSSALFSSLGLNDMNNSNMPTSVAPIGTKSNFGAQSIVSSTSSGRPHSSTDWTAAGAPWSSASMFGTSSQQQQLGTSHWSAGVVNNVQQMNNSPGIISPPKTSSMMNTSTQRPLLSNSTIARPSPIGTQSNASSSTGAANSATGSSRMPPNWHAVFNQMAQQLGDVAEKEKQQKAAAAQAAQANVYAPYATAAMDDRLQFNGLMHASGGIPINSTEPQPQSASHSSVIKSYLDSMPKDFDLNLALSNSANEQIRQSFYNHMTNSGNGLRGQSNTPMPRVPPIGTPLNSQQPPVSQSANMFGGQSSRLPQMNPNGGSTTPGGSCFVQPPPGFASMPVPGQRSMTPVQQMQPHTQPLPNGNATAAAWSTYGYDTMWNKRR